MDLDSIKNKWQSQKGDEKLLSINTETLLKNAKEKMKGYENFVLFAFKLFLIITIPLYLYNFIFTELIMNDPKIPGDLFITIPLLLAFIYEYYILRIKKYDSDNLNFIKSSIYKIRGGAVRSIFILYFILYLAITFNPADFIRVMTVNKTIFYLTIICWILIFSYGIYYYFSMHRPILNNLKQLKDYYEKAD